jgi:hypothetical protein
MFLAKDEMTCSALVFSKQMTLSAEGNVRQSYHLVDRKSLPVSFWSMSYLVEYARV